jgi:L-ascorbate metabolism protein UlaG (beta-lactamase superfamily)
MHIGGARQFDFGKVKLTQAFHGSAETFKAEINGQLIRRNNERIVLFSDLLCISDMVIELTQAFHGSAVTDEENKTITYTGMPAGILLTIDGKTVSLSAIQPRVSHLQGPW